MENTFAWAITHKAKVAFGTDLLLEPTKSHNQSEMLTRMAKLCGSAVASWRSPPLATPNCSA